MPPVRTAAVSRRGPRSSARDRTIRRMQKIGRRSWKKESGYGRQGTVENALFRYKSILGDRVQARTSGAQEAEALIACNILNRMFSLADPSTEGLSYSARHPDSSAVPAIRAEGHRSRIRGGHMLEP